MKTISTTLSTIALLLTISLSAQNTKTTFQCNFDCPSCEDKVMKNIPYEKGVKGVDVDYENKLVTIEYKVGKNNSANLQAALVTLGYNTQLIGTPTTIGVKGNCDMCKDNIETAAKSLDGVSLASWDATNQKLTFVYNDQTVSIDAIHNAIAEIGYDTDKLKADDNVYDQLHSCCKYER